MIKAAKWLYINPLTVVLFVLCYINRRLGIFLLPYTIMLIHELAHLCAACWIGLKPAYIAFHPFGVNLKLKNRIVYSLADEIILYLAGPFANILMALAALIFFRQYEWGKILYMSNLALFCMNMLPVVPLDGGIVLKKILLHRMGYKKAQRIMMVLSACLTACFMALGVYIAVLTKFNYSMIFLSVLMIGNIFTQREKYNVDFLKELMFYQEKGKKISGKRAKVFLMDEKESLRGVAQRFNVGDYSLVCVVDKKGEIEKFMTETEIIRQILNEF